MHLGVKDRRHSGLRARVATVGARRVCARVSLQRERLGSRLEDGRVLQKISSDQNQ